MQRAARHTAEVAQTTRHVVFTRGPQGHVAALDGLRGVAILLVLFNHFTAAARLEHLPPALTSLVHAGWIGVDLFFVLSGFLITGILADTVDDARYFVNFYVRRALRIFPLYYGVLVVIFVGGALVGLFDKPGFAPLAQHQWQFWTYATNITQAFWGVETTAHYWLRLSHFWSLAVEEQFYLVWPLFIWWLPRERRLIACFSVGLLAFAVRMGFWATNLPPEAAYLLTPCRVDGLAFGACVALLQRDAAWAPQDIRRLARNVLIGAGVPLLLLVAFRGGLFYLDPALRTWGYSALGLTFAAAIALVVTSPLDSGVRRALEQPWLCWAGTYSYGAYIFHDIVVGLTFRVLGPQALEQRFGWALAWCVAIAAASAATWGIAVASHHLYERPFLKLKKYFEPARSAATGDISRAPGARSA